MRARLSLEGWVKGTDRIDAFNFATNSADGSVPLPSPSSVAAQVVPLARGSAAPRGYCV
jgi:hypothetical protein